MCVVTSEALDPGKVGGSINCTESHWEYYRRIRCAGQSLNTLRPRQNGRHFADDPFKRIFLNENVWISLKISLKFVPRVRINNIPALVPILAWRRSGDKPLSKPMMVSLLTHISVIRPQWVKAYIQQRTPRAWHQAFDNMFPVAHDTI